MTSQLTRFLDLHLLALRWVYGRMPRALPLSGRAHGAATGITAVCGDFLARSAGASSHVYLLAVIATLP